MFSSGEARRLANADDAMNNASAKASRFVVSCDASRKISAFWRRYNLAIVKQRWKTLVVSSSRCGLSLSAQSACCGGMVSNTADADRPGVGFNLLVARGCDVDQ
jgi:hypothetical protein